MTFTKCHYRAIPFYIVGFDTGKTGNTKVGQKGYFFKPALLEDEELTGSVNRKKNNDAQFSDINGLQVTILSSNSGLKNVVLPWPPKGSYFFDSTDALHLGKFLSVREEGGKWTAHCMKPAFIRNIRGEVCYQIELMHGGICWLENADDTYALYTEFSNRKTNIFHNYHAQRFTDITIGRTPENDIQYSNSFVSRHHAILYWDKNNWIIRDNGSTNGLFVNNMRVEKAALHTGDSIFIMGLRINIGIGFLSINDENGRIRFSSKLRRITENDRNMFPEKPYNHSHSEELFNRLPRKREALNPEPIIIEAPPMKINDNGIPLVLRMGGSMVMSSAALLAGNITSMISSVFFPVLTQKYTKKQKEEYEAKRQEKYRKYLIGKKALIEKEVQYEKRILAKNYQELSQILLYAEDGKRLWERRVVDDDFLEIRIGHGCIPMLAERRYPERRFEMDEDSLLDLMYELAERPYFLEDAPIMTSFIENYVSGVTGSHNLVIAFMKRLIMQLTILHSYDEMKLVILCEETDFHSMHYVRYLPHVWNNQKDFRFLATNTAEASQISEYLKNELGKDVKESRNLKEILKDRPYYIVIAFAKKILDSMQIIKDVMRCDTSCGVSVITAYDDLPKECMKVFHLNENYRHSAVYLNQIDKPDDFFQLDDYNLEEAKRCMKKICNTSLRVVTQAYSLPKMVTFLEMYGIGNVEQLNPLKRWKENNSLKSLSAPIGVATDGSLFTLDLHEKFQGPHGLVAGMTGSGKSEFIITYILSMAVNYSPEEVAFILIDYKGGGLARAFDDNSRGIHLPHLVGTITNLDGAEIQRSMKAVQSELLRRQRLFNTAKTIANEGSMDIYEYQKLYRKKLVSEPLPHLFMISDEFAELKKQEPDFMDKLISTARIGRSLGVHLILATQKPSGVVNDQIWSNSKFKICLKVQDKADSVEMLKRPEAAELKDTGRFYLQVGYDEFFALGQSAWCGADYEPSESVIVHNDKSVQIIDPVGQLISEASSKTVKSESQGKQLDAIVRFLSKISLENCFQIRDLWCPSLPKKVDVKTLQENTFENNPLRYKIRIGLLDDPENQEQFPLEYDFAKSKNLLIVGEPRSGKTTLIQTMILSLVEQNQPQDLHIYTIDYSSRMMKLFRKLPHIGEVLDEENEESFRPLIDLVRAIVSERKQLFASLEVSTFEEACEIKKLPLVLVFIDNFAGFKDSKMGNSYQHDMPSDLKYGPTYGVKYILTCTRLNEISMKIRQELGDVISFQMKDKYEYGEALGCRCDYVPPAYPGRGMYCNNGRALELHAAMYWPELSGIERSQKQKEYVRELINRYKGGIRAKRIQSVSETNSYKDLLDQFDINRIPLGYTTEGNKPIALPLKQFSKLKIYFGNPIGVIPVLENILSAFLREQMDISVIKREENSIFDEDGEEHLSDDLLEEIEAISSDGNSIVIYWKKLAEIVLERRELLKSYCENNQIDMQREDLYKDVFNYMRENTTPICFLIEEFSEFCKYMDPTSTKVFCKVFQMCRLYQIYIIACFYPESTFYISDILYKALCDEDIVLLFGGRLDMQDLCELPKAYSLAYQIGAYDRCLVRYRDNYYPLYMPCTALVTEKKDKVDVDEQDIFAV